MSSYLSFYIVPKRKSDTEKKQHIILTSFSRNSDIYQYFWENINPAYCGMEEKYTTLTKENVKSVIDDFEKDTMDDILQSEREKVILNIVMDMGEPCATILKGSFWQEKSIAALTHEMKYSSSDTTKNQKSRCLRRLKCFIVNKLRKLGYDY